MFGARVSGSGINDDNEYGVWRYSDGGLRMLARWGTEIPGVGPGVPARYGVTIWPTIDDAGNALVRVTLVEPGETPAYSSMVLRGQPGALAPVLLPGDPVPGAGADQVFLGPDEFVTCNRAGDFVFEGWLAGPGIDGSNNRGTWVKIGDSIHFAGRIGDHSPGTPDGVVFSSFSFLPLMGNNGTAVFSAEVAGPGIGGSNNVGFWAFHHGATRLVVREGDPAPGAEPGVVFRTLALYVPPVVNGLGQVAFEGFLEGPGIDESNEWGLWMSYPTGEVLEIARPGQPLDLGGGDVRTIRSVDSREFTGGGGGTPTSLNDQGELAFWASFTDGSSAILVASTIADSDGDGLPDDEDACPDENPQGLDANGDGCVDRLEGLSQWIEDQNLDGGIANALIRLADNAEASMSRGQAVAARRQLEAMISLLSVQRGRRLPDEQAGVVQQFIENALSELP